MVRFDDLDLPQELDVASLDGILLKFAEGAESCDEFVVYVSLLWNIKAPCLMSENRVLPFLVNWI